MKVYTKLVIDIETSCVVEEVSYEHIGQVGWCKGGGGGQPADTSQTIRYAPYIESQHQEFLGLIASSRDKTINDSPFSDYDNIIIDEAFFGAGYLIGNFPSLYDMYGKFMAGLDIDALWDQVFEGTVNSSVVSDLVAAESILLEDDIETNALPSLQAGLRDINSVISSSYVTGRAILEDTRTKLVNKFSADLKYRLIPVAQARWEGHLNWNKLVVATYSEIMKLYFSSKMDVDDVNYSMSVKDKLWPFTVLDYERAALGALQGATNQKESVAGASRTAKVIAGAMSGAAMGAMVGGSMSTTTTTGAGTSAATTTTSSYAGYGAVAGAVLGAAAAYYY